jgi:hypothetical protein
MAGFVILIAYGVVDLFLERWYKKKNISFFYSGSSDFLSTILRFSFHIKIWSKVKLKGKRKKKKKIELG